MENFGLAPTFETRRGSSVIRTHIDVTLSRNLQTAVRNWRVCTDYNASDHNTIHFEVEANKPEPDLIRPWKKADWQVFKTHLGGADYAIPHSMSMKKLDKLVDKTYKILGDALDRACPMSKIAHQIGKSHWATEKHDKGKAEVNTLYKRAKASGLQIHWDEYKIADKKFKRMCKNDKNKAWRKYKECIQTEKEMASLAKMAQQEEKRDINVLTRPDGTSTDPGEETIKLLTETHFPAATGVKHVTYNNRRNMTTAVSYTHLTLPTTPYL